MIKESVFSRVAAVANEVLKITLKMLVLDNLRKYVLLEFSGFCGQFLEAFCKDCSGFIIQTPSFYCEKHNRNNTPFSQKYHTNLRMLSFLKYFI